MSTYRPYHKTYSVKFKAGDKVYSKRVSSVPGFEGVIVELRGNGFQVLNPKTGNSYQRDHWDLIAIDDAKVKEREGVE